MMLRHGPTFAGKEDGDEVNESWRRLQFFLTGAGLHAGAMHETAGAALARRFRRPGARRVDRPHPRHVLHPGF